MKSSRLALLLGFLIGLAMQVIGAFMVLWARPELRSIQRFEHEIVKQLNVEIITFGMIINAGLFFLFIRFGKEQMSRGILMASVLSLLAIFIYRYFT